MKTIVSSFIALFLMISATQAQVSGTGGGATGPVWSLSLATTNQSISGTPSVIQFNTKDNDPQTVCLIATNPGRCTPVVTGYYLVTCQLAINGATGPGAVGQLGQAFIEKNGSVVKSQTLNAQVAAIASPSFYLAVTAIVQISSSSDYIECYGASNNTTPVAAALSTVTFFAGHFVHS